MALAPTPTSALADLGRRAGWAAAAALGLIATALAFRLAAAERAAETDPLTGLLNRRGLARAFARRLPDAALLFLDLDGFKAVNDRLGHPAGDRLLVTVAARLRSALGPDDILGRWGGDEFLLITREPLALEAAMRDAMSGPFDIAQGAADGPIRIGFSLGATRPGAETGLSAAVAAASRNIF
jgi:diguanylate cyclase (GGDEF)-like protein